LANAGDANSGVEVRPAFIGILKELSRIDAVILEKIYSLPEPDLADWSGIITKDLPENISKSQSHNFSHVGIPSPQVQIAILNLVRLGVLEKCSGMKELSLQYVYPTLLGREFFKACSSPSS